MYHVIKRWTDEEKRERYSVLSSHQDMNTAAQEMDAFERNRPSEIHALCVGNTVYLAYLMGEPLAVVNKHLDALLGGSV